MEVQQLRHLQAAANSTSYAQAAKKCFTSRQNIAHSIKALESELGVVLFFRKGNTMELTPDGKQVASLRQISPWPELDINPEDAARLGIENGDWCEISSRYGHVRQKAKVTPTIKPGVVHAMHGFWYPEEEGSEPNLYGNWKSNINMLMPNSVNAKSGFGNTFKSMICNVVKVQDIGDHNEPEVFVEASRQAVFEIGETMLLVPVRGIRAKDRTVDILVFPDDGFNLDVAEFFCSISGPFKLYDCEFEGTFDIYRAGRNLVLERWAFDELGYRKRRRSQIGDCCSI